MRIDFVQHVMTETEIASLIALEVEEGQFGLADASGPRLVCAGNRPERVTSRRLLTPLRWLGCIIKGRAIVNEARNQLVELGERKAA